MLLVGGAAFSSASAPAATTAAATAVTLTSMTDCSEYQNQGSMPPYGCEGTVHNATDGSGESGYWPWPQNISGWGCYKSHCGYWSAYFYDPLGGYQGNFLSGDGCWMQFVVYLSYGDAWAIKFHMGPRVLWVTPFYESACN